jgi:ABC-2 type transport system permease protein
MKKIMSQIFPKIKLVMKKFSYYLKMWVMMTKNSFLIVLSQKTVLGIFLLGKILRFVFFILFLFFLISGANNLAGYNINQSIFFFLTYMIIDTISQFLYREAYKFRSLVVSGDFDLVLVKPTSALFRVLAGGADIIDFITIPPLIFAVYYVGRILNPSNVEVLYYFVLVLNALLIATSFHIIVLALGIITLEIDHTIMIYRDLTSLGRFPIDIYKEPLRSTLLYILPIGVMMTIPVKTMFGLISIQGIILSITAGVFSIFLALKFWDFALKKYTSASS